MKQVPFLIALCFGTMVAAMSAHGQISRQTLSFSIYAEYSTNKFSTNRATGLVTTNQVIKTALISTATVVRDIAVDLFGADYTNWTRASLLRETDADGHEGIFLYKASPPTNVNVSSFFSMSFKNDFTYGVTNNFTPITNMHNITDFSDVPDYNEIAPAPATNWSAITNFNFNVSNPIQEGDFEIEKHGTNTEIVTNFTVYAPASVSLCYISLNTANLQFNLIGYGTAGATLLIGRLGAAPARYTNLVQTLTFTCGVGTYRANLGANLLDPGPEDFVSGPVHIYLPFGASAPAFSTNLAAEVFGP
jgi:hypothetical protein